MTAAACAILQGCRGYAAIAQWLDEQPLDFLHALGFTRWPPTESAVRKLFARIDAEAFERAIEGWTQAVTGELPAADEGDDGLRPMDLDGKSLRGTWNRFEGAVLLLNMLDRRTGCVHSQHRVPSGTNEHKASLEMLRSLVLEGRIVAADAIFCQQDVCATVVEQGGHYVLPVKENQPGLLQAIQTEFAAQDAAFSPCARREREAERDEASTLDKGHGRIERRTLTATTGPAEFLREKLGWSGVRQAFRIVRERTVTDRTTGERRTSREVAWGITSLDRSQADAARLLSLARGHWAIENRVFYVRDEAFGEDRCRVQRGNGPQVLAAFRNLALAALRSDGSRNISASLRHCTWNLPYVLKILRIRN